MPPKTERDKMHPGAGTLLNEDNTTYDFTAGFRALALAVATLPALVVSVVTRLTSILANGVLILVEVSRGVIDGPTGTRVSITYPHHEIHEGNMFKIDQNTIDLDDAGNNDALHVSFTTPDTTKEPHLIYLLYASGAATFEIVEAPTGGVAGGTGVAILNRNRNSDEESTLKNTNDGTLAQYTEDATAPVGGTVLHHEELGSGKNRQAGESRDLNEFVLKRNTTYSFRLTSLVGDVTAQMTLNWYENTDIS